MAGYNTEGNGWDVPRCTQGTAKDAKPNSLSLQDVFDKGSDIGYMLKDGQADRAKQTFDDLVCQIYNKSADPQVRQRMERQMFGAMAQQDPDDVKTPDNGDTAPGWYYVYWNTESTVNEVLRRLGEFEKTHPGWDHYDSWGRPPKPLDGKSQTEVQTLTADINKYLAATITDSLEPDTFVADFTRRYRGVHFEAVRDDTGKAQLRLGNGN